MFENVLDKSVSYGKPTLIGNTNKDYRYIVAYYSFHYQKERKKQLSAIAK